ncbi:uncharacterized protein LOC143459967 [Clavelina lepadiformis]|uniref:uncharacterized protein LOC143459967 n=1 Tax=Clavelina lepadiformis TaxID=159417 RepID=UPI0040417477
MAFETVDFQNLYTSQDSNNNSTVANLSESGSYHTGWWTKIYSQKLWIAGEVVSALCVLVSFYLLICITIFVKRENSKQGKGNSKRPVILRLVTTFNSFASENGTAAISTAKKNNNQSSGQTRRNRHRVNTGGWMRNTLLFTVYVNFFRVLVEQMIFLDGGSSDVACNTLTKLMITLTAVSIHGCLVFLWLRQFAFYANPLLRKIRPRSLKLISFATYVEMVVTVLLALVLHLWWRDYFTLENVCVPLHESETVSVYVPFGVMVISTVSIQISLTFLFVYPIVCHNVQMKKRSEGGRRNSGQAVFKSTNRLLKCVKRALVGGTVGITTDVIGAMVSMWLLDDLPIFVLSVLYELNILLNIGCLLYTYVNWREIVFPWLRRKRVDKDKAVPSEAKDKATAISTKRLPALTYFEYLNNTCDMSSVDC